MWASKYQQTTIGAKGYGSISTLHPEPNPKMASLSYKDTYLHLTLTNSGIGGGWRTCHLHEFILVSNIFSKSCFFVVKKIQRFKTQGEFLL